MGYIKFFLKKHLEKLISAMVFTAKKPLHARTMGEDY